MKSVLEIAGAIANKYAIRLQPEELRQFASIMESRELRKGEVFLDQGQIAKDIIYVYSGTIRLFYYKKGTFGVLVREVSPLSLKK